MRKRIWILCFIGIVSCLLLLLLRPKQQNTQTVAPPPQPQPRQEEKQDVVKKREITNLPTQVVGLPANATALARAIAETNAVAAKFLANWQTPIDFYGKVMDENSNPIVGARITFDWVEKPAEDGNRTTNTESDAEGLFSLQGQRGPDLGIEVICGVAVFFILHFEFFISN